MTSRLTKSTASSMRSRTSASTSESRSRVWPGRVRKGTAPSGEDASNPGGSQRRGLESERREERLGVAGIVLFEHSQLIWRHGKAGEAVEEPSERTHRHERHENLAYTSPSQGSSDDVEQLLHGDGVTTGDG